jgi:hypothetical protein
MLTQGIEICVRVFMVFSLQARIEVRCFEANFHTAPVQTRAGKKKLA